MRRALKVAASSTAHGNRERGRMIAIGLFPALLGLLPTSVAAISFIDPSLSIGLGTANLYDAVIRLIGWVLGLLGIIAVIMVLWGGFQWMVSGGNEERVDRAKKTLSGAIVGLIIILLAWAIVRFVLNTAANVTGAL